MVSTNSHPSRIPIDERLRSEPTAWLSSTRPDGRPHVVPVWFNWDGHVFDLFSKPTAQKVRNVRERPDVMLAFGEPEEDWDVELVEGIAAVLEQPTAEVVQPSLFEKYAALMARAGLDRDTYTRVYSQPVRVSPTRFLGYGGKGWTETGAPGAGDSSADVTGHVMRASAAPLTSAQRAAVQEILRASRATPSSGSLELMALDE